MWGPYSRLGTYLAGRARAGERAVTLTLAQIEALVGQPLPDFARDHAGWWSNAPALHPAEIYPWYGWLSVGWEAEPDLLAGTVTFRRRGEDSAVTPP